MAGQRNLRKMEPLMRLSLMSPLFSSSHRARKLVNTSRNSLKVKTECKTCLASGLFPFAHKLLLFFFFFFS